MSVKIIVGGDIVPSFKNLEYFQNPTDSAVANKTCMEFLRSADFRIYNLETPITDDECPIHKEGANFSVPSGSVRGLKSLMSDSVSVANNHCMDHGVVGLKNTIDLLTRESIVPIGYGFSHKDANDVVTFEKDGVKVSIIACAETEFNIFKNDEIGAVPYHDFWTNKKIADTKKDSDVVIVMYHGGTEYFPFIPPYLRERCHLMAENGADYIFCQHSHCIGCYENYADSTIVYGQGNFIFHQKNNRPITKEGLLIKIHIEKNGHYLEYVPVVLNELDQVCLADNAKKERILEQFEIRSQATKNKMDIESEYQAFADQKFDKYITRLHSSNWIFKFIIRVLKKLKVHQHKTQYYLGVLNLLQNESHRELLIAALKKKLSMESKKS